MKRTLLFIALSSVCFNLAANSYRISEDCSELAMLQTMLIRDPASLGAALPNVPCGDGAYASFGNAASAAFSDKDMNFGASFGKWEPTRATSSNSYNVAYSCRLSKKAGFSMGISIDDHSPYDITDEMGYSRNAFKPSDLIVAASANFRISGHLSAGATAKYLLNSIYDNITYSAAALDLSLAFNSGPWSAFAGFNNLGTPVKGEFRLPAYAYAAAACEAAIAGNFSVRPAIEADAFMYGGMRLGAGIDLTAFDMVSLRAGYNYGIDAPVGNIVSFGAGFKYRAFGLDFAYLASNFNLKGTVCIGLHLNF